MKQRDLPVQERQVYRRSEKVAHGDWRMHVSNPDVVLNQEVPPLSLFKKLHLRVEYLEGSTVAVREYVSPSEDIHQERIRGWARLLRLCVAFFILMPLSVIITIAIMRLLYAAGSHWSMANLLQTPVWFTLMGALVFFCLHILKLFRSFFLYAYVIGHELSHAVAAILCLGKIHRLKINKEGGYVETDKNNFFIALAPYFLPLWMLVWVGLVSLSHFFIAYAGAEELLFIGLGFWWSFHIYWTLWILPREQPDMLENGLFFSALLIWVMNLLILVGILRLFKLIRLSDFTTQLLDSSVQLWYLLKGFFALVFHFS